MHDRMTKEIWLELKGLPIPDDLVEKVWEGPTQVRIEELKLKMKAFELKMQGEIAKAKVAVDLPKEEEKKSSPKKAKPVEEAEIA